VSTRSLPEIELPPGSRVIADLHLDPEARGPWRAFEGFVDRLRGVPALVILGDLFEYWVGPGQAREPEPAALLARLGAAAREGTRLHVVHGNRDFLLGAELERASGAHVHPEGCVGRLASGRRVLLVHGDELATDDHAYQRMRAVLRSAPVRLAARGIPYPWTRALARRLRRRSVQAVAAKSTATVELKPAAALDRLRAARAERLVCGHAHRYRHEELAGGLAWTVLDAFGGARDMLLAREDDVVTGASAS
jgi:UDP-2,3-diacylglucosamine hydrolase